MVLQLKWKLWPLLKFELLQGDLFLAVAVAAELAALDETLSTAASSCSFGGVFLEKKACCCNCYRCGCWGPFPIGRSLFSGDGRRTDASPCR